MTAASLITIPARKGKAAFVAAGQVVRVINTHGQQVVDTWAFNREELSEFMSMEHSRTALGRIMPVLGQSMVTNRRRPILTLVEDTSGGIHDTLLAACDRYRYEQLGVEGYHDNCTDNLAAAMGELGLSAPETPSPWNLFMNIPVGADGSVSFEPPVSKAGDYVVLRAEMDLVVAFSACPQDIVPINGMECVPTEAHFEVVYPGPVATGQPLNPGGGLSWVRAQTRSPDIPEHDLETDRKRAQDIAIIQIRDREINWKLAGNGHCKH